MGARGIRKGDLVSVRQPRCEPWTGLVIYATRDKRHPEHDDWLFDIKQLDGKISRHIDRYLWPIVNGRTQRYIGRHEHDIYNRA